MFIEPGTKIISGVRTPHQCLEDEYEYEKIQGTLLNPLGQKVTYNMLRCNKCGAIIMKGNKVTSIEKMYKNYEFVHVPKTTKGSKPTKKQIRNAQYLNDCFVADALGMPRPKKKGKQEKPSMQTPDYVLKGEAPKHMQQNAYHPFRGGGVSPR